MPMDKLEQSSPPSTWDVAYVIGMVTLVLATWFIRQFFLDFRQKFPSADFSFSPKVGSVYFLNTHWDHLGNRF
jgi:hypothetical protein